MERKRGAAVASGVQAPDSGPGERERPFERQDEVPRIDAALAFEARRHVGTAGDHRNELALLVLGVLPMPVVVQRVHHRNLVEVPLRRR